MPSIPKKNNSSSEYDVTWVKADVAVRSVIARSVNRSLESNLTKDALSTATRERIEIEKMIAHVRQRVADAAVSSRGWTWHLLKVLDWDSADAEALDEKDVNVDHRAIDKKWKAEEQRLRAAVLSYKRALPDLLWSAQCFDDFPPIKFPEDIYRGLDVLERALDYRVRRSANWRLVKSIHGRVRRYDHLRAAAMHMLVVIHDLGGRGEHAKLAKFIVDRNAQVSPRPPCPRFARDDPYDNARKIRSRAGL